MGSGAVHALSVLLVVAAAAKLRRPERAVDALRQARLPASPALVRLLAVAEIVVAAAVLAVGGPAPALALAALHIGFAAFVARLRATAGAAASCGCFGGAEAPADRLHVVVNAGAAAVAALAGVTGADAVLTTVEAQPAFGLPYLVLVGVAAQATLLLLTGLPRLLAASRQVA